MKTEISAFAERLKWIISREFRSAAEFAKVAGVSPHAVSHWLRARREPSRDNLIKLAAAAHVSVGWLAAGEGPLPPLLVAHGPDFGKATRTIDDAIDRMIRISRKLHSLLQDTDADTH